MESQTDESKNAKVKLRREEEEARENAESVACGKARYLAWRFMCDF